MQKPSRTEKQVFRDLELLCSNLGYVHAIAQFCLRDNLISYSGEMKEVDLKKMFSPSRLIRTEISTLLGLMIKNKIDWTPPSPDTLQKYMDETERLLEELHHCLSSEFWSGLSKEAVDKGYNPFQNGAVLREPIFYAGESAYNFQYLNIATLKYSLDSEWLKANRGFTIDEVVQVANASEEMLNDNFIALMKRLRLQHPDDWTILPLFTFSAKDVALRTKFPISKIEKILEAFTLRVDETNQGFNALNDFNVINSSPLIRLPSGEYLSFQSYAFSEAIYEAPYYWMLQDKFYQSTLAKNRGDFTEKFVADRLSLVFGSKNVYPNVEIFKTKSKRISEIDALVIWGNRILIVQAKSKRLTLESRKGNDQVIRDDFIKAVQDSYDQGVECAKTTLEPGFSFIGSDGSEIVIPKNIEEIYIFCVVSDHYPALSFQARQFLQTMVIEKIQPPLVIDVFALDAMTEMLQTPLHFLSYINRRCNYAEQLIAAHELTILGYHLKNNLWVQSDVSLMHLCDDFSTGLDIAMTVRRKGVRGAAVPEGVLTRLRSTTIGRIIDEIEQREDAATIDLGFFLLSLSEQAINEMSALINRLSAKSRLNGAFHDISFIFKEGSGITFHLTDESIDIAGPRLRNYCVRRKYKERANKWFGLCMSPSGPNIRFGITSSYQWSQDSKMDEETKSMQAPISMDFDINEAVEALDKKMKVGRNDPCPCGSGNKYKKCCLA